MNLLKLEFDRFGRFRSRLFMIRFSLMKGIGSILLVEDSIIVEVKALEALAAVHHLQVKTYLKLSGKTLGFLINFNVPLLKQGLNRIVLNHPERS